MSSPSAVTSQQCNSPKKPDGIRLNAWSPSLPDDLDAFASEESSLEDTTGRNGWCSFSHFACSATRATKVISPILARYVRLYNSTGHLTSLDADEEAPRSCCSMRVDSGGDFHHDLCVVVSPCAYLTSWVWNLDPLLVAGSALLRDPPHIDGLLLLPRKTGC